MRIYGILGLAFAVSALFCADVSAAESGHENCGGGHAHGHADHKHGDEGHAASAAHRHGDGCEAGAHGGKAERAVAVPPSAAEAMGIKTVRPVRRVLSASREFYGRYELNPDARFAAVAPVAGFFKLAVKPLQRVRKGELLFTVRSPELVSTAAEIAVLEKRLEVFRQIGTRNAALENELLVLQERRKAMLLDAEEKDGVVSVRAQRDAMVEELVALDGAWLETGGEAVKLVCDDSLRFAASLPDADCSGLSDGMAVTVDGVEGKLRIGIGDAGGKIPVFVLFDRRVTAFAGKRGRAFCEMPSGERPELCLPRRCVVKLGVESAVFVADAKHKGRYVAHPVTPGASAAGLVAVKGLHSENAEVVCDGAYELRMALDSGSAPAGHFHADGTFHTGEH